MSSSSNSPKEISSTRTAPSPTDESLWTVSLGIKSFSSTSGWSTSPSSSTHAPSSSTTQSSSRFLWYWRESAPPGATVMILTVQGRLWVYCSNPPQGFSTFTEGGQRSKLNPLQRSGRGGSLDHQPPLVERRRLWQSNTVLPIYKKGEADAEARGRGGG